MRLHPDASFQGKNKKQDDGVRHRDVVARRSQTVPKGPPHTFSAAAGAGLESPAAQGVYDLHNNRRRRFSGALQRRTWLVSRQLGRAATYAIGRRCRQSSLFIDPCHIVRTDSLLEGDQGDDLGGNIAALQSILLRSYRWEENEAEEGPASLLQCRCWSVSMSRIVGCLVWCCRHPVGVGFNI